MKTIFINNSSTHHASGLGCLPIERTRMCLLPPVAIGILSLYHLLILFKIKRINKQKQR